MSKNELKIKSNGLRNELKEIRKSIDLLTHAIMAQTHKRYEKCNPNGCPDCNCKNNVLQDDV
jgi:hypothetical protein